MTEILTDIPNQPAPTGITALSDWYPFGPDENACPARNFTIEEVAMPLNGRTYMTTLFVGGMQHHDGEIVSFIEIQEDIVDGQAPDSEVVQHLAAAEPLLSPTDALELAHHLDHLDPDCEMCRDEVWSATAALRFAVDYLRDFREANGMAAHDGELT
jgi:hypothetical protein